MPRILTYRPPSHFEALQRDLVWRRNTSLGISFSATLGGVVAQLWNFHNEPSEVEAVTVHMGGDKAYQSIDEAAADVARLNRLGLDEVLLFQSGRFYLQPKALQSFDGGSIAKKLGAISWLRERHRMACASLKNGLSILFHRDFVPFEEFLELSAFRLERRPQRKLGQWKLNGTAFAVAHAGRLLWLTAKHTVKDLGGDFQLVDTAGNSYPISVAYTSPAFDFALLDVPSPPDPAPTFELGTPDLAAVNDPVTCVGYANSLGPGPSISRGRISQKNATYKSETGLLQLSNLTVNPSSSGGPLIDDTNRSIGIITTRIPGGQQVANVVYAEPLDRVMAELQREGRLG